jgi:hypothetical protein
MKRFQEFIGRAVDRGRCGDAALLGSAGLEPRYLPETFDEFDEMDFLAAYEKGRSLVLSVALEQKRIQRILIGWAAPGDPDDAMRTLGDEELAKALDVKGDDFKNFLAGIT